MPTQELLSHRFDFCVKKIFVLKKFNSIQTCVNSLLTIHKHYLRISKLFNFVIFLYFFFFGFSFLVYC